MTNDGAEAADLDDAGRAARLGKRLSAYDDRAAAAQSIVDAATAAIGCSWAVVARRSRSRAVADASTSSDDVAATVARFADELGEGVGATVLQRRDTVVVNDLAATDQWPHYRAELLRATPVRAVAGFYLHLDEDEVGALLLYDDEPDFFTAARVEQAGVFADLATVALARTTERERATNLSRALASNRVVGQALGIIMARESVTADAAWDRLREASMRQHRRVADLAEDVTLTGELSEP